MIDMSIEGRAAAEKRGAPYSRAVLIGDARVGRDAKAAWTSGWTGWSADPP